VRGEDGTPVELGRGAMGVTYKAFDVDLRCSVALKIISEQYLGDESVRRRFLREARAAASVRHPNVASVFHLGRTGQNYFYAMEFVEGETLENLIKRSGKLEVRRALEIATQVAARLGPEKISVARLPVTGSDIFGREEDIAFLDRAWTKPGYQSRYNRCLGWCRKVHTREPLAPTDGYGSLPVCGVRVWLVLLQARHQWGRFLSR
jgi:Protein kinase domain